MAAAWELSWDFSFMAITNEQLEMDKWTWRGISRKHSPKFSMRYYLSVDCYIYGNTANIWGHAKQNPPLSNDSHCSTSKIIIIIICHDYELLYGVPDWKLDLWTTLTHDLWLLLIIALSLNSILHKSAQAKSFQSFVFSSVSSWQRLLTVGNLQLHRPSFLFTDSESESKLLYDWWFTANQFVLVTNPLRLTTSVFSTEHLLS
jgi:hypothetical protein